MRNAIAILVLANLLALIWGNFQQTGSSRQLDQPDSGDLRLLTEYPQDMARTADPAKPANIAPPADIAPPAEPPPGPALFQPPLVQDSPIKPVEPAKPAQTTPEPDATAPKSAHEWASQIQDVFTPPAAQQPIPAPANPAGEPADEEPPIAKFIQHPPGEPVPPQPGTPVAPATCWRVGHYATESAAQKAAAKRPQDIELTGITPETTSYHLGYIVLVPAKNGMRGARQTVKKLRSKKIDDYQILKTGPFAHAVSVGAFKAKDKAQQWVRTMHKKGLTEVVMQERVSNTNKYWLELTGPATMPDPDILQPVYPDVSVQQTDCQATEN